MQFEPIPVLGVTGPVAAGKSALSARLAALGARVIDVDGLGHRALASDAIRDEVVRAFGAGVAGADGSIDRARLALVAFADGPSRLRLEAIVHPVVLRDINEEIRRAVGAGAKAVVLDCALLFESGLDALCDLTVDVDAPEAVRLSRALASQGWDAGEVRRRTAAQIAPDEKRARADRVVVNDGDAGRLDDAASEILAEVRRGAGHAATRRTRP